MSSAVFMERVSLRKSAQEAKWTVLFSERPQPGTFPFRTQPSLPRDSWPGVHVSGAQYTRAGRVHVRCGHTLTWGAIEALACPRPARGTPGGSTGGPTKHWRRKRGDEAVHLFLGGLSVHFKNIHHQDRPSVAASPGPASDTFIRGRPVPSPQVRQVPRGGSGSSGRPDDGQSPEARRGGLRGGMELHSH